MRRLGVIMCRLPLPLLLLLWWLDGDCMRQLLRLRACKGAYWGSALAGHVKGRGVLLLLVLLLLLALCLALPLLLLQRL